jgi:ParB-like partition proteins
MATNPNRLGGGLSALFGGTESPVATFDEQEENIVSEETTEEITSSSSSSDPAVMSVPMAKIRRDPSQPRKEFSEASLAELATSIEQQGLIQPIVVRETVDGYLIIAGERRFRACGKLGKKEIDVIVRNLSDQDAALFSLAENLQREDLSPLEEANGYKYIMDTFSLTVNELSDRLGKPRSTVSNSLRLLGLTNEVQEMLDRSEIAVGHAKVILGISDKEEQTRVARQVAEKKMSVREVEKIASKKDKPPTVEKATEDLSVFRPTHAFAEFEVGLRDHLRRYVKIVPTEDGGGLLTIKFFDENDLFEIGNQLTENA